MRGTEEGGHGVICQQCHIDGGFKMKGRWDRPVAVAEFLVIIEGMKDAKLCHSHLVRLLFRMDKQQIEVESLDL